MFDPVMEGVARRLVPSQMRIGADATFLMAILFIKTDNQIQFF